MIKLSDYVTSFFTAGDLASVSLYDTIGTFTESSPISLVRTNSVFNWGAYSSTNSLVVTPYSDAISPLRVPVPIITEATSIARDSVMSLQDPDLEITAYIDSNLNLLVTTRWTKLSNSGSVVTSSYAPTTIYTSMAPNTNVSICAAPKGSPDYGSFIVAGVTENTPGDYRARVFKVGIDSYQYLPILSLISSSNTDAGGYTGVDPYLYIDVEITHQQDIDRYHIVVLHILDYPSSEVHRTNGSVSKMNLDTMDWTGHLSARISLSSIGADVIITRGYLRVNPLDTNSLLLVTIEYPKGGNSDSATIQVRKVKEAEGVTTYESTVAIYTSIQHVIEYGQLSSPNSFSVSEVSSTGDFLVGSTNGLGECLLSLVTISPKGMNGAADVRVDSHTLSTSSTSTNRSTSVQLSTVDNKSFLYIITDGSTYTKYLRGSITEDSNISSSLLDSYYSPWYDSSTQPGQPAYLLFHSEDIGRFYYGTSVFTKVGKLREATDKENLGKLGGFVSSVPTGPIRPILPPSILPFAGAVAGAEYYINELGTGITTSVPYIGAPKVAVGLDSSNIQLLKGVFYD